MKFKVKDENIIDRNLEDSLKRIPLRFRFAGVKPEEMLKVFKPEEMLRIFKSEEILKGLKPEDRLKGLKTEELKRLKEILDNPSLGK